MDSADKVIKDAPFTAVAITETVQTLTDGNRIVHNLTARIARDGQGRTRRELWTAAGKAVKMIVITDPVAGVVYDLVPGTNTAHKNLMTPPSGGKEQDFLYMMTSGESTSESLGRQTIEGVSANGTRTRRTIKAGAIGNKQPFEIISEIWYSPELQTIVRSKGDYLPNDPQIGETTYQLTNIQRGEPPQALFVPGDYIVHEEHQTVPFTTALPAPTWDGFTGLPRPNPKLVVRPTIIAPPER